METLARLDQTAGLERATAKTRDYVAASVAGSTKRAYATDFQGFAAWCRSAGLVSLPASAETVAVYASYLAESAKPSTIARKLASISVAHKAAGHESPTGSKLVRSTVAGIRRTLGVAQDKKAPVRAKHLKECAKGFPDDIRGKRDKALLLIGYAGAFRRSELVALDLSDVTFEPEGVVLTVRRSKTDQDGKGLKKAVLFGRNRHTCPVQALKTWLEAAGIQAGPIFPSINRWGQISREAMTPQVVALVVKERARLMGLDPDMLGAHSLRAGLITDGFAEGVASADIARQSGHKSQAVLEGYYREANKFRNNVTAKVGL